MSRIAFSASLAAAAAALTVGAAHAQLGPADFTYYTGYNDTGSGFDFSGQSVIGSDTGVVGIQENRDLGGSNTSPSFPTADVVFMADVTTTFNAAHAGTYSFTLGSDDGAYAFVDNSLFLNDGGIHGTEYVTGSIYLTAGLHNIELQYGNLYCCGAVLNFAGVPEPSTWGMTFLGVAVVGGALRSRRKAALA